MKILVDVIRNLPTSQGYAEFQGPFTLVFFFFWPSARGPRYLQKYQANGQSNSADVTMFWMGNGVSELIVMAMQGLSKRR